MKVRIKRDDQQLLIHDDTQRYSLAYAILAHEGLGSPPVERIRLRGWRQDGETDIGAVLRPRRFSLVLLIDPYRQHSNNNLFYVRQLLRFLAPDKEVEFEFELLPAVVRRLNAALIDAVTMPSSEIYRDRQKLLLNLEASDPLFYDAQLQAIGWSGIAAGLAIPLNVNITMGDGALDAPLVFSNDGTYPSACTVIVRGPCSSFTLTLNGVTVGYGTLAADRELRINSAWGRVGAAEHNAATGEFIANRLAGVIGDLTRLRVIPRANTARVSIFGGSPQTQVTLAYTPAYLSL